MGLPFNQVLLIIVLLIAVVTDVKTRKIKNWLTFPAIAAGPIVLLFLSGKAGAISSLQGIGIMIAVSVVAVSFGVLAGGDIKLLVAVGSLGGLNIIRDSLLLSALAGGILAMLFLIRHRQAAAVTKGLARAAWLKMILRVDSMEGMRTGIKIPYSIAIAAGTVAAMLKPL